MKLLLTFYFFTLLSATQKPETLSNVSRFLVYEGARLIFDRIDMTHKSLITGHQVTFAEGAEFDAKTQELVKAKGREGVFVRIDGVFTRGAGINAHLTAPAKVLVTQIRAIDASMTEKEWWAKLEVREVGP